MNLSALFIARPVATTLLTIGIALAGIFAFFRLPVSPLPQVDFPTISVQAQLPGASPDTVATSVAEPLERHLGQIADVTEMTSTSSVGQCRIVLQFGLNRDINGAARDVEAAINAARADLPSSLRSNPTYRKVNPADAPIMILALTSKTLTRGQIYDAATNVFSQSLSQLSGIGQVIIGGAAMPAVRVELNPTALNKYGIGLEDVRAALASANANSPKGAIEADGRHYQLYTNDQASHAADYKPLVIAYRNGAAVRLSDMGEVQDSVENLRNLGLSQGQPAVLVIMFRQPGANIISTVDAVKAAIPHLMAAMPADVDLLIANDRTTTIRASLRDTQFTLLVAVGLVTLVVFAFLRSARATLIPAVAVPVSIIGTFGTMYLLGYSLDNLSLMALTIATGFVVDDAIVVLENISRHIEAGMPRVQAALLGAREVGFTVISISLSLIAVFLPILLMGGIVGRLFREFGVTLSMAILVSLAISLTTTAMMCAVFLRPHTAKGPNKKTLFDRAQAVYARTLTWSLRHLALVMLVLLCTVGLNVWLYVIIPKGLFPQQDTGRLIGGLQADQSISFQLMEQKLRQMSAIVQKDPAVQAVVGFTGQGSGGAAGTTNTGNFYVALKPLSQRDGIDQVMARLRRELSGVPGARLFLQPVQDIRVGGRQGNAAYQYTLQADSAADLYEWAPKLTAVLEHDPIMRDVNSDQQQKGLETDITIDRATASRLGINPSQIDNTLYDAFGQRQVSTIYSAQNQYHVVMEVAPRYWQSPQTLRDIYVSTAGGSASGTETTNAVVGTVGAATTKTANVTSASKGKNVSTTTAASIASSSARNAATNSLAATGKSSASSGAAVSTSVETMIPLAAVTKYGPGNTPLAVNHQGPFVAATISFNLAPGKSLSDATASVLRAEAAIRLPANIHGSFQGTARTYEESLTTIPQLIVAALAAIYIVLGVLYESYIHPITIISTLPSAGVGALLALLLFNIEFSIIAAIGIILLIGIVKKNAILMIDFALEAQRTHRLDPRDAIFQACLTRFRPIMMTTSAALLGALPLALSFGDGGELRRPLGISIVGGLMVSQVLTLYTTPVVYLYMDRLRLFLKRHWESGLSRTGRAGGGRVMRHALACVVCLATTACMVGPDYKRPDAPAPVAFKEMQGWKMSQPADAVDKGDWWSVYHDPELDRLERMVEISNQTIKVSEAQYRNAVALVAEARASLFPTVGITPGVSRFGGGGGSGSSVRSSINSGNSSFNGSGRSGTTYSISGTVDWVPDIWGSVRRQIESSVSSAQVSAADLANAKLSAQATLATDYFDLRAEDSLARLLNETVAAYRRALQITENQYRAGTTASTDYLSALAQLQSTEAQLIAVGVQRAQFEHAIAVLTGHAPAEITIAPAPLASEVPILPPGLPSELLERRPDIAAAERAMQQENALIGVAVAAFYPTISLSALGEYAGNPIGQLFNAGNRIWSLGASGSETLFNGGERSAAVEAARATYDASVASYRQTVLTAFQGVEDALSNLRILEQQARALATAVASTERAVAATLNQYKAGTVPYTSVITEQTLLLSDQQSALAVQQSRLVASVALIEALGGGWSTSDLPAKIETASPLRP